MRRLALDLDDLATFRTTFHGSDVFLDMDLRFVDIPEPERTPWAFIDFPTTLRLSGIEEFHFQTQWEVPQDLLSRLAACMPAVTTLVVRHDPRTDEEDVEGHVEMARTVVRVLESDSPVLFPNLTHLELIVSNVPLPFCELVARALQRRDMDGRRLRKLRIRIDDEYWFLWKMKWMDADKRQPSYEKTGIFDHVDSGDIRDDNVYYEEDSHRVGWGKWEDCVQPAEHEYWQR